MKLKSYPSVESSYDAIVDQWNNFCKKRTINKCIVDFTKKINKNANILDVGCGTGYPISAYLSNNGFHVTGIDISSKMIEKAKQLNLSNATFYKKDLLNFETNEQYDAIIAFDSLWHIDYNFQKNIYQKLANLLKKDGLLLFTHGKENGEIVSTMFDKKFYHTAIDLEELKNILHQNNFEILNCIENYAEPSTGTRDLLMIVKKK